ncbi:hypothetical protein Zmor_001563 [Zophobas morio]|uniref:Uncharacterized protein n=2 Tax=Zophobas morio TaxID=2755281 RepID=A0AA38J2S4_9CUCU|nr:hypothetical protein Zmor_001563 [Zophobas morio]
MPEKKPIYGFGSSVKRFRTLGIHPELISINTTNPLGPGQYNPKHPQCAYASKAASWKTKFESEEFSKYLGHKHPQMLCDRNFRKTLGGPGNYEIRGELPTGPSVLKNVGFGTGERFHSPIKDEKLPPGSHTIKKLTTKFSKTPTLEWGGFSSRFKSTEPAYRQAPNRYNVPHYSIIDKKVSKRGPYDTFTGPRDQTTIKNHFAPALFKTPDIMYNVPSALDHLLHNPSKKRYGKFLQDERFPEGASIMATKNGLTMYMRDTENPGPAIYNPYVAAIKPVKDNLYPFNSSNVHARPPQDWKIHPGPDRYEVRYPTCHMKRAKGSWVFLSKASRGFVKVESYSNFLY